MARLNDFLSNIDFTDWFEYINSYGKFVSYAKGEAMVHAGHRCRFCGSVISGYFKYVVVNSKGNEVVTGFSFAGEVVTDLVNTWIHNTPCVTSIIAGCNSEVLQVSLEDIRKYLILQNSQLLKSVEDAGLKEAYSRYLDVLVKTPSERYDILVDKYSDSIKNIPINELASYLGITRRQFLRIRKDNNCC